MGEEQSEPVVKCDKAQVTGDEFARLVSCEEDQPPPNLSHEPLPAVAILGNGTGTISGRAGHDPRSLDRNDDIDLHW